MSTQLQEIVDTLAAQINRAVAIDDPQFHLVVHSPHHDPVDKLRQISIMRREVPPGVVAYSHSHGVREADGPVRLPANADLEMWSRVCVPIRCTTLYHRLRQVEKIAEVDLSKGNDRLALHLGLKLARLSGRSWAQPDDERVGEGRPLP